jgi:hypothetical protein
MPDMQLEICLEEIYKMERTSDDGVEENEDKVEVVSKESILCDIC